jgi:hypothetical protein
MSTILQQLVDSLDNYSKYCILYNSITPKYNVNDFFDTDKRKMIGIIVFVNKYYRVLIFILSILMNKYFGIVLAILSTMVVSLSTTFAMLSESKMEVLETAANKIVTILEKEDISMESFMMILDKVESNIQGQETKLMVLDVLKELTLDIYYKVDDFSECISYYDGCNTCGVEEGVVTFCTEMACTQMSTPSCEQYA